ncbi:helix-turn-helix domain-containing protein [Streptomyces rochei]|uniref:helix-turn-helix domain-containing protein n=1 Tax=Streptomyces rochei TaxID=1928 RepID=UPI0037A3C688
MSTQSTGAATGTVIRELRRVNGLTRAELAERVEISEVFLAKIEQGSRGPSPRVFARLAEALALSAAELAARISLIDAGNATSEREARHRALKAVAVGGWAAAALLGPTGLMTRAATAMIMAHRLSEARWRQGDGQSVTPAQARRRLHDLVDGLTDQQVMEVMEGLPEDGV